MNIHVVFLTGEAILAGDNVAVGEDGRLRRCRVGDARIAVAMFDMLPGTVVSFPASRYATYTKPQEG